MELIVAVIAMVFAAVTATAAVVSACSARSSARIASKAYEDAKRIYVLYPKRDVLRRLVAHSHLLTIEANADPKDALQVLNEAAVIFGEHKEVVELLGNIKDKADLMGSFDPLVRAMAQIVEVPLDSIPQGWFQRPIIWRDK